MERFLEGVMMEKIVIVVKQGMVQSVYAARPYHTDIEILDLDCTDPEIEHILQDRLQEVEQVLCKIY